MTNSNGRHADHAIEPMFLARWSPRAFTDEAIDEATLMRILEAARWAPSGFNGQPWRFVYGRRGTASWAGLLEVLLPVNRLWAKEAAALVFLVSKTTILPPGGDAEVPSYSHAFDTGAASGFMALQANALGWHVHGMGGIDRDRAVAVLGVPAGFRVEAAFAVGRRGDPATLPEALQARERPSDRIPLKSLAFEGAFPPQR